MAGRSSKKRSSSSLDGSEQESLKSRGLERPQTEQVFRQRLGLATPSCSQNQCPKNRDDDPFCLCHLGEGHATVSAQPKTPVRTQQPNTDEIPAGLENLGNTCYMNSYLQTLFHNLPIRRIVFAWRRPPPDQRLPRTPYGNVEELQRLLARLQLTRGITVNPADLVKMVGMDVAQQHDVQEFSMLFLDSVDKVIAEYKGEEKLQSLFTGKCRSVVKCHECKGESAGEFKWTDLGLQANDIEDINGSLKAYFKDEQIDDYACERCSKRTVVDKSVRLSELPRFLNLHVHRYFYDREAKQRKKLSHPVAFTALLDLRPFLSEEQVQQWGEQGCCYDLKAVLIHRGDAHSGHYFARIRVAPSGKWYTFDDDVVTPYEFSETNVNDAKGAYLLVYERLKDVERESSIPKIPDYVDVSDVDRRCSAQLQEIRSSLGDSGIHRFLANMKVNPDSCIVFLPTTWLISIVRTLQTGGMDNPIPPPNLTFFLCSHRRLGNMLGLKAVDGLQAGKLLAWMNVIPRPCRLDGSHFCSSCTRIDPAPESPVALRINGDVRSSEES